MRLISGILVLLFFATACEKNKFTTKPQLRIKEATPEELLQKSQILTFRIQLTDKEGDFTQYFGYAKSVPGCPLSEFIDSNKFRIPAEFINAGQKEGEVVITMSVLERGDNRCSTPGGGSVPKIDTATYKFWTKDLEGNVSDTAYSKPIIIHG
jgi:hypothetical protein